MRPPIIVARSTTVVLIIPHAISSFDLPAHGVTGLSRMYQIVLWDEVQSVEGTDGAGSVSDKDVAAETAQLLLYKPKRQAVKVGRRT